MAPVSSIKLFDVEPDLARYLSPEDRGEAGQTRVPLIELGVGQVEIRAVLQRHRAFAAVMLDGLVLQSLRLGEHPGLRLLGPGDVVSLSETPQSMLVLESEARVTAPTRLALLGREMLLASRRWPWLVAGLHGRTAEQSERVLTQLMICQLPRVDDRLLAIMWLLAESWGQVTASGTVLPIELTHSALGGLIGARRPTVTLALSELTERGALIRQSDGWLLLEQPAAPTAAPSEAVGDPQPLALTTPRWDVEPRVTNDEARARELSEHAALCIQVQQMRIEHRQMAHTVRARVAEMVAARKQVVAAREQLLSWARSAPSSRSPH